MDKIKHSNIPNIQIPRPQSKKDLLFGLFLRIFSTQMNRTTKSLQSWHFSFPSLLPKFLTTKTEQAAKVILPGIQPEKLSLENITKEPLLTQMVEGLLGKSATKDYILSEKDGVYRLQLPSFTKEGISGKGMGTEVFHWDPNSWAGALKFNAIGNSNVSLSFSGSIEFKVQKKGDNVQLSIVRRQTGIYLKCLRSKCKHQKVVL